MDGAAQIVALARTAGVTITTAESCTGGMVAAALTDIPGSSDVFERGFVTYSNAAKVQMIAVDPAVLDAHGAVSEATAQQMAQGAAAAAGADIAVAISGIAGPGGGTATKPEGMVCFALTHNGVTQAQTQLFGPLGRKAVRQAATDHALNLIFAALQATDGSGGQP